MSDVVLSRFCRNDMCFLRCSGMGCFWGAERKFWRQKGVYSTQVGYAGGYTPNPTYKEVCSGKSCSLTFKDRE